MSGAHPAVDAVLGFIKDNWQQGSFSDIPLKRIDRDNSELLDGSVRSHGEELRENNYVSATLADVNREAIGTEYDHDVDVVVGVRVEGAYGGATDYGYVDPDAQLPPANAGDPVPWFEYVDSNDTEQPGLIKEIQDAILRDRRFPSTRQADISYTDLQLENDTDLSSDFGDFYLRTFEVTFSGFETLP